MTDDLVLHYPGDLSLHDAFLRLLIACLDHDAPAAHRAIRDAGATQLAHYTARRLCDSVEGADWPAWRQELQDELDGVRAL